MSYLELDSFIEAANENSKLIDYVVLAYSSNSELLNKERMNPEMRKAQAYKQSGLKLSEDEYHDIFYLKNELVFKMAMDLLKHEKNMLHSQIISSENLFLENLYTINQPITETDDKKRLDSVKLKSSLLETNDKIVKNLKVLRNEFFGKNTDLKEAERLITPESVAKRKL